MHRKRTGGEIFSLVLRFLCRFFSYFPILFLYELNLTWLKSRASDRFRRQTKYRRIRLFLRSCADTRFFHARFWTFLSVLFAFAILYCIPSNSFTMFISSLSSAQFLITWSYKVHSPFLHLLSQTSQILRLCRTSCHSFGFLTHFFVLVSIPFFQEMTGSQLFR